ncbi:MAG: hypothetical protein RBR50_01105 [Candidatus Izemoplasmatales bacterium]|nr:hypothetical protein [Candidatus Izemoplasmatales bacterium]
MSKLNYGLDVTSQFGINRNTFHVMKNQSKDKFDYIAGIDSDFAISYKTYLKRLDTLEYLNDIVRYYLLDSHKMPLFSKILASRGVYTNPASYMNTTLIARRMDMRKMGAMVSVIKVFIENRRIFRSFIPFLRDNYEIREVMKSYKYFLNAYGDFNEN